MPRRAKRGDGCKRVLVDRRTVDVIVFIQVLYQDPRALKRCATVIEDREGNMQRAAAH